MQNKDQKTKRIWAQSPKLTLDCVAYCYPRKDNNSVKTVHKMPTLGFLWQVIKGHMYYFIVPQKPRPIQGPINTCCYGPDKLAHKNVPKGAAGLLPNNLAAWSSCFLHVRTLMWAYLRYGATWITHHAAPATGTRWRRSLYRVSQ